MLLGAGALTVAMAVPAAAAATPTPRAAAVPSTVSIAAPKSGDVSVVQLALRASAKPVLALRSPANGVVVYGSVVRAGTGTWTLRIVVIRTRHSAAAVTFALPKTVRALSASRYENILHSKKILDLKGVDPAKSCKAFAVGFSRWAGSALALPAQTIGSDACLLAARAQSSFRGWTTATKIRIPTGFTAPYWPVTVSEGVSPNPGFVRAGKTLTFSAGTGFAGWTGDCTGSGACTITVNGPVNVTATYAPPAMLSATLTDTSLVLSQPTVTAGRIQITGSNAGSMEHRLAIHGTSGSATIPQGGLGVLTVNLSPGTYTVYCPLPGHEAMGMSATLTVV